MDPFHPRRHFGVPFYPLPPSTPNMYSLPLSTAPISGPLLVISTAANLVLGFVVIVSDFLATAIPDTIEHAQLTAVRSRTKRKQMTRKNVVAPLLEAATPMAAQQGDNWLPK